MNPRHQMAPECCVTIGMRRLQVSSARIRMYRYLFHVSINTDDQPGKTVLSLYRVVFSAACHFCFRQSCHLQAVLIACNVPECKLVVRPQVYTVQACCWWSRTALPIARSVAVYKMNDPSPRAGSRVPRELKCLVGGPLNGRGDVATWITIRVGLVSAFGWCAGHGQSQDV